MKRYLFLTKTLLLVSFFCPFILLSMCSNGKTAEETSTTITDLDSVATSNNTTTSTGTDVDSTVKTNITTKSQSHDTIQPTSVKSEKSKALTDYFIWPTETSWSGFGISVLY